MAGRRAITTTHGKKKNMTGGVEANSTLIVQMCNLMHMAHKVGGRKKNFGGRKNFELCHPFLDLLYIGVDSFPLQNNWSAHFSTPD
jgi:hypothetical protein